MRFNIMERIMILGVLPEKTDFISTKILMDLRNVIGFSQNEMDKSHIVFHKEDGRTSWDNDFEKEVRVTKRAAEIIIEGLKKLHETKEVRPELVSIFEKFKVDIEIPKDIDEEFKP